MTDPWPRLRTEAPESTRTRDEELLLSTALATCEVAPVPARSPPFLRPDLRALPLTITTVQEVSVLTGTKELVLEVPVSETHITVIRYYTLSATMPSSSHQPISFHGLQYYALLDGNPIPDFQISIFRGWDATATLPSNPARWQKTSVIYLPKRVFQIWLTSPSLAQTPVLITALAGISGWRYDIRNIAEATESLEGLAYDSRRA